MVSPKTVVLVYDQFITQSRLCLDRQLTKNAHIHGTVFVAPLTTKSKNYPRGITSLHTSTSPHAKPMQYYVQTPGSHPKRLV